jgi:transient receptor potential cation channel subfamily M protein 3
MNTIRTVLEYVTDTPPVPVVVIEGSGRAADLIAFTQKFAKTNGAADDNDDDELPILDEDLADQLMAAIRSTFNVNRVQAENLLIELLQCVKKKNLITVFGSSLQSENDVIDSSSLASSSGIFFPFKFKRKAFYVIEFD